MKNYYNKSNYLRLALVLAIGLGSGAGFSAGKTPNAGTLTLKRTKQKGIFFNTPMTKVSFCGIGDGTNKGNCLVLGFLTPGQAKKKISQIEYEKSHYAQLISYSAGLGGAVVAIYNLGKYGLSEKSPIYFLNSKASSALKLIYTKLNLPFQHPEKAYENLYALLRDTGDISNSDDDIKDNFNNYLSSCIALGGSVAVIAGLGSWMAVREFAGTAGKWINRIQENFGGPDHSIESRILEFAKYPHSKNKQEKSYKVNISKKEYQGVLNLLNSINS